MRGKDGAMKDDETVTPLSPQALTRIIELPRVSEADIAAAAARMCEALRRLRAEPHPDAIWNDE